MNTGETNRWSFGGVGSKPFCEGALRSKRRSKGLLRTYHQSDISLSIMPSCTLRFMINVAPHYGELPVPDSNNINAKDIAVAASTACIDFRQALDLEDVDVFQLRYISDQVCVLVFLFHV